jgi:hypothetical protein
MVMPILMQRSVSYSLVWRGVTGYYKTKGESMDRKRIIAGGAVIVVLIVALAYALTHTSSPSKSPSPAPAKPNASQATTQKPKTPSPGSANSSQAASGDQSLSNSGPGDVIAVFAGATALGYLFFLYRRAQLSD